MIGRFREQWRRFREQFWLSLAFDVAIIAALFLLIQSWQTRDLPIDQAAPETVLALLDGSGIRNAIREGEAGIVYFFAPWCLYCRTSIGNLDKLVSGGSVSWGTAIALDFENTGEVREFIDRTGVVMPVLLGNSDTAVDWSIRAFPTYYVVDADGRISSRSVGYATGPGMLVRNWLAQ
jgi:thiol-disulfide isomerase/thioredoxin